MLILNRTPKETIVISDDIEIKILSISNSNVCLGITAPLSIPIYRKEIYERMLREKEKLASLKAKGIAVYQKGLFTYDHYW